GRRSSLTEGRARAWRTDWAGSGRPSDVAMMQATDFANRDDSAEFRPLNWPAVGCILVEREVSTRPVIVREVASQGAPQMPFAEAEDVIQTLAPDRADEPLREGVLPRAVGRRQDLIDPHALHSLSERVSVDLIAIAEEVGRGGVVRERVHDLLGRPGGGGMVGDVEVEDAPAIVGEHNEDEEHPEASSRDRKEIDGDQIPDVIGQERSPALRGRPPPLREQAGDGALGHIDAELQELTMDSRRAPERIRRGHLCDKGLDLRVDWRGAHGGPAGEVGSVLAEARPLPPQNGVRGNDGEGLPPPSPDSGQAKPEEPISHAESRAGHRS